MIRLLHLADTHLGFDLPTRPRVERRRRGPDFFANTRRALDPAARGEVDVVVHGGDLLNRSKVSPALVAAALEPLLEVADRGIPVLLVPGNHERSALPYPLLASHANLHVFDRPGTVVVDIGGVRAAFSGFPCQRDGIRSTFVDLVEATEWRNQPADVRLLCMHQAVEGARVHGFTFRGGPDVIRGRDVPGQFAAVLCGHIHRSQVLRNDLAGRKLAAPVFYPGSVERTSLAERHEVKGYFTIDIRSRPGRGGETIKTTFRELPTRPMCRVIIDASGLDSEALARRLGDELSVLPADAVVQIAIDGSMEPGAEEVIRVSNLGELHPATMSVELRLRRSRGRDLSAP